MTSITTKRGDKGRTGLFGAKRVSKGHILIEIIGQIDELQVLLGQLKIQAKTLLAKRKLEEIQHFLYLIMADLSGAQKVTGVLLDLKTTQIEEEQTDLMTKVNISHKFILPGNNSFEITAHLIRVKVRTIERLFVRSSQRFPTLKRFFSYFNRLSDYFFVVSQSPNN